MELGSQVGSLSVCHWCSAMNISAHCSVKLSAFIICLVSVVCFLPACCSWQEES